MSSVLLRFMHSIFGRSALSFDLTGRVRPAAGPPDASSPGASALMLGRFVEVYCNDILIFSKTREEHLVHVHIVLETLLYHKLFAKASKCQFGGYPWDSPAKSSPSAASR